MSQMERTEKCYRLSTGREVYAHRGLIGISVSDQDSDEDSHGFEISEGYDGHLDVNGPLRLRQRRRCRGVDRG